eukprot:1756944-Pleurochrysis_carterae.AAC.1
MSSRRHSDALRHELAIVGDREPKGCGDADACRAKYAKQPRQRRQRSKLSLWRYLNTRSEELIAAQECASSSRHANHRGCTQRAGPASRIESAHDQRLWLRGSRVRHAAQSQRMVEARFANRSVPRGEDVDLAELGL